MVRLREGLGRGGRIGSVTRNGSGRRGGGGDW